MIREIFPDEIAVILGTGPSLTAAIPLLRQARAENRCRLIGMNNTYLDFPTLDGFTACDPKWWLVYGADFRRHHPSTRAWTWDVGTARQFNVEHIQGTWEPGLSTDRSKIHYGHSSGYQALGIARHLGCDPLLLAGFDMRYPPGQPRHYFQGLSGEAGEYPEPLRKFSTFDGLLGNYATIASQTDRPTIINVTPASALGGFPHATLEDALNGNR